MPEHSARTDRRVNRSRRLLRDALMELILEKGYDAVTVEDITERADLGRTTFYLHYKNKEELLLGAIDEIADELKEKANLLIYMRDPSNRPAAAPTGPIHPFHLIFEHAAHSAKLYRIILQGEGANRAERRIREIIAESAQSFFQYQRSLQRIPEPPIPVEVISGYLASSLLGFLHWWLENNMPYSPAEMAEMYRGLFFQGVQQILGLPANLGNNTTPPPPPER